MLLPAETMSYRAFPSNRDTYKGFCYRAYYPYYENKEEMRMPKLSCDVSTCMHNEEHCCCKSTILVDGEHADCAEKTCCCSFDERDKDSFKNSYERPNMSMPVECEAYNCIYNENKRCQAEHIGIAGDQAKKSQETECSSFRLR